VVLDVWVWRVGAVPLRLFVDVAAWWVWPCDSVGRGPPVDLDTAGVDVRVDAWLALSMAASAASGLLNLHSVAASPGGYPTLRRDRLSRADDAVNGTFTVVHAESHFLQKYRTCFPWTWNALFSVPHFW
jgi:hypothetical protein